MPSQQRYRRRQHAHQKKPEAAVSGGLRQSDHMELRGLVGLAGYPRVVEMNWNFVLRVEPIAAETWPFVFSARGASPPARRCASGEHSTHRFSRLRLLAFSHLLEPGAPTYEQLLEFKSLPRLDY
jgi:hypothetical protein